MSEKEVPFIFHLGVPCFLGELCHLRNFSTGRSSILNNIVCHIVEYSDFYDTVSFDLTSWAGDILWISFLIWVWAGDTLWAAWHCCVCGWTGGTHVVFLLGGPRVMSVTCFLVGGPHTSDSLTGSWYVLRPFACHEKWVILYFPIVMECMHNTDAE